MLNIIIRQRPLKNKKKNIVKIKGTTLNIYESKKKVDMTECTKVHKFNFDKVYADSSLNKDIYYDFIEHAVGNMFHSLDYICYAYGQTGSGKTHTIIGDENDVGLINVTLYNLFRLIDKNLCYSVNLSSYEVYNDKLYDLLNNRSKLNIREDSKKNINIYNLVNKQINNYYEFEKIFDILLHNRNIGISSKNDRSSRSHVIIKIQLVYKQQTLGKITFVDLAGSERGVQSICNNRDEFRENSHINKSLLALKECIRSLKAKKSHIPFRSSKLSMVLRDAFTNRCSTLMIGTISAEKVNISDTLNTLKYTSDVKFIKKISYIDNKLPNINESLSAPILPIIDKQSELLSKDDTKLPNINKKYNISEKKYSTYVKNSMDIMNDEVNVLYDIFNNLYDNKNIDTVYCEKIIKILANKKDVIDDIYYNIIK